MPELPSSDIAGKPQTADAIRDIFDADDKITTKEAKDVNKELKDVKIIKENKNKEDESSESDETADEVDEIKGDEIKLKGLNDEEEERLDLKDDKDESDENNEDKIEVDAPPRKKQLLADFPDLFKKHPFLEKMLYRDREYTQLFGSFDDAKEIAAKNEVFNNFESQLLAGNTVEIIKNVKSTDPKAFDKIVDDYLPALSRVDRDAYYEVVGNVGKQIIMEMITEAKSSDSDQLRQAALALNQFLFNSSTFTPPKSRTDSTSDVKDNEVEVERRKFNEERYNVARTDLQSRVDNVLRSTISEHIDPKGVMTAYIKRNAIKEAVEETHKLLREDSGLRSNLDKLWRGAADSKFNKADLDKIQSAYLGKARGTLSIVIKRVRAEALKDLPVRAKAEKEEIEETPRKRGTVNAGSPHQQRSEKGQMKRGESVSDFFARD